AFFGPRAGASNTTGVGNTTIGYLADVGLVDLTNATAIGAYAQVTQSNSLVLGGIKGVGYANASTNVGIGTTAPTRELHVVGGGLFTNNSPSVTDLVIENGSSGSPQQVYLSNYGTTGAGNYWLGLSSANTSSLLGSKLFVLRSPGGLVFS